MTGAMNDLIRRAVRGTQHASTVRWGDDDEDDLGGDITPDDDQGRRNVEPTPPISTEMNRRIRLAAGISVRPDRDKPPPEIGTGFG